MAKAFRVCALGLWFGAFPALAQFCPGLSPWVFDDVASTHPFCADITWMAQRGVTLGCTTLGPNNRLYCPNDSVTRGQMAAFMRRLGTSLFPVTCAAGQVMKWSGAAWACADDNASGGGSAWSLNGNSGTNAATNFVGTTNNVALVLRANNVVGMRIVPADVSPNVIGGNGANAVVANVRGATIAGGGVNPAIGDPVFGFEDVSRVSDHYGTIGGGYANWVGDNAGTVADRPFGTVAGGAFNQASGAYGTVAGGGANHATNNYASVGGGEFNEATGAHATVAGGQRNRATGPHATVGGGGEDGDTCSDPPSGLSNRWCGNRAISQYATVSGGVANLAGGFLFGQTVGGGLANTASGISSTVPGGESNVASGDYSFAAGAEARAVHLKTFVWNGAAFPVASTAEREVTFSAPGGVRMLVSPGSCTLTSGSSGWQCTSDRALKSNIIAVDGSHILDRVVALPIARWSFSDVPNVLHMGPMAQDFHAAFGLGDDDRHLAPMDVQGVALAAIQGLNAKLHASERELASVRSQLADVTSRLVELSKQVEGLKAGR